MSFSSVSEFVAMGGHGLYVWSAYALTLLVILFNLIRPMQLRQRFIKEQSRYIRREETHASGS